MTKAVSITLCLLARSVPFRSLARPLFPQQQRDYTGGLKMQAPSRPPAKIEPLIFAAPGCLLLLLLLLHLLRSRLRAVSEVDSCKGRLMYDVILRNARNDRNVFAMAETVLPSLVERSENNAIIRMGKKYVLRSLVEGTFFLENIAWSPTLSS